MKRIKVAPTYDKKWLESNRPQPLADNVIECLQLDVLSGNLDKDISDQVYTNFKQEMTDWLFASKLNTFTGFDTYGRVDIITGCTQFIDALYMNSPVQVIEGDYRYHARLGNNYSHPGLLREGVPLIIAMPFPSTGAVHAEMNDILDEAQEKGVAVHIDGAWITCCRGIDFDVSHPAIHSVGISLSKGLGLGWNRVGLRWVREYRADSVTIQNDFNMNLRAPVMIGLHFLRNLQPDHLWNTHGDRYYKVCRDFDLTPTNSIYLALANKHPVGVSPLIRYLENADT
jgi:hypothetical protein